MRKVLKTGVILMALLFSIPALADQITLKNGDHVTGTIVKSDAKALLIKTDYAGDVTLKWSEVSEIKSDQELYVGLTNNQIVAGIVSMSDGKIQIETKTEGTVTSGKDSVQYIRNDAEQAAALAVFYRLQHPRLTDFWSGFLDAGLSGTRGNSDTTSLNFDGTAVRTTVADKITVDFNSILTKSANITPGVTTTTAHSITGDLRGDFNLGPRAFAFAQTQFQYDELEDLNLRNVLGGGVGVHVRKTANTVFDVYGGGAYDQAYYTSTLATTTGQNITQKSGEINAGEDFAYKLSNRTSLAEQLDFWPNLSDTGQYRVTFNGSAATKIKGWLDWQVSINDRYVSNPIPGIKTNDLVLMTGIRVTFGKGSI
ncbi:MAG: DUF481 domain-containing protein [Candidatus Acidiferrales bacterium]